jgi:hypothetical protein
MKKLFWISSVLHRALRLTLPNTTPQRTRREQHGQTGEAFGTDKWAIRSVSILLFVAAILFTALHVNAVPRIALMDFVSEDNSCRSTVALSDLVGAVQAEMSGDTNYEWVERAELEKAANEFKLAGFGFIDRSEAIRSGRWVKADWGIFGDVSTNLNGSRTLSLEVVNLERADVLAETNLSLSASDNTPFQMKIECVSHVAAALREVLNQAQQTYSNSQKQEAVALLFLSRSGMGDGFENLEDNFRDSLSVAFTNSQRFHLIQFQRAGVAMDEANLVLSGLAENDSNSWQKVADYYVWGNAAVADRKYYDWKINQWQDEQKVDVTLNVWDGRSEPRVIALSLTNETSEAVAKQLEQAIEPLFHRDLTKPVAENIRSRISDLMLARYTGLPLNFSFDLPDSYRQWLDAVQLLETACFFNPGNAGAREQLLRLRWGTSLAGTDAGKIASAIENVKLDFLVLAGNLECSSRNKFFFTRRRSEAWRKYVEQFGFTSTLAKPEPPSIAIEYVLSAWQTFEMFRYAQDNQAQWGVPRDAGLREVTEWQNQFGSEFVSRLLEVSNNPALAPRSMEFFYNSLSIPDLQTRTRMVEKYWPRILEQAKKAPIGWSDPYLFLRKYFKDIGQPDGDQQFLAQLDLANKVGTKNQEAAAPPPPPVQLPRLKDLKSTPTPKDPP